MSVLDEREAKLPREERDRLVVVPHDERDVGDALRHESRRVKACWEERRAT